MQHAPDRIGRIRQIDHGNGERAERQRSPRPAPPVPASLAREIVDDKERRQADHEKQKISHAGLLSVESVLKKLEWRDRRSRAGLKRILLTGTPRFPTATRRLSSPCPGFF